MENLFTEITKVKEKEAKGAIIAFVFLFILFASYFIAKPVRDSLASDFTDTEVSTLWTITFFASTAAVMIYNFFLSKFSLKSLIPAVFITLRANVFDYTLLGKIYYIWVSVFALFHISVFWSFMSQIYTKEQSKRLFAFVNVGASVGAILGSLMGKFFVKGLPLDVVMFMVGGSLVIVLPFITILKTVTKDSSQNSDVEVTKLSSNPFSGLGEFITHKRLIGIAFFFFIFVGIGTFFYMAYMNGTTIILGLIATNRITSKFGLSSALASVPALVAVSLMLFATTPTVAMFLVLQVLRKAGNYSITRPCREILFTGVDQEARFKTKPFIDIVVYRGGDFVWGWFFVLLGTEGLFHLSLPQKLIVGGVIAIGWAIC